VERRPCGSFYLNSIRERKKGSSDEDDVVEVRFLYNAKFGSACLSLLQ
jgi:hypothetical protein